jgi:hypothetical protein
MIAEDFLFDTTKIKRALDWKPTLRNSEMLVRAYRYYSAHRAETEKRIGRFGSQQARIHGYHQAA